jgi:hypothetical protein
MLPTIATGNVGSALAGEYEVANSCRFSGGNDYLRTTGFGTPTSSRKMTLSFWCKRSGFAGNDRILTADTSGSNNNRDSILFTSNALNIFLDNAVPGHLKTNRLFRDASAWFHIVIAIDTTQSTDTNRIKIYVNGVQETSFDSSGDGIVYPSQNYDLLGFGQNRENTIGADSTNGGDNDFFDGYLAEYCFIDGQQLDPTSFGEFDEDSSIWKPIDVSGLTFGNNGFYLDFENSGSLGADVSGNGNNFTVNNLTSIDQSTDTCTNNFATMNPLNSGTITFSDGNLTVVSGSDYHATTGTIGVNSGKWYFEVKINSSSSPQDNLIGITGDNTAVTGATYDNNPSVWYGGGTIDKDGTTVQSSLASFSAGSIVGIALNMDDLEIEFYHNGSKQGSTQSISSFSGFYLPFYIGANTRTASFNFGSPPYSVSSGNSDASGHGNFEYAVPSGYYALNTKNLAEYG